MYRLATKTKTGEIEFFGPPMPIRQAQAKQAALTRLTSFPVYVINPDAL